MKEKCPTVSTFMFILVFFLSVFGSYRFGYSKANNKARSLLESEKRISYDEGYAAGVEYEDSLYRNDINDAHEFGKELGYSKGYQTAKDDSMSWDNKNYYDKGYEKGYQKGYGDCENEWIDFANDLEAESYKAGFQEGYDAALDEYGDRINW